MTDSVSISLSTGEIYNAIESGYSNKQELSQGETKETN
jgi:hypothetical protein